MLKNIKIDKRKVILFITLTFAIFLLFFIMNPASISADVGNNNRYDSGNVSSSSSDGDGIFFLIYMLIDVLIHLGPIGLIIAAVIVFFIYKNRNKIKDKMQDGLSQLDIEGLDMSSLKPASEEEIEAEIRQEDENFSGDEFKQFASECFVTLQSAWTAREWAPIRHFETDTLFNMHNRQLQEYINNGTINVVERLKVRSTKIISHSVQGDKEVVCVQLKAVMRDYIIDENTRAVVDGDRNRDIYTTYRMEFIRTKGVKTVSKKLSVTNCPNCGAPTQVTSSGQCEYCDSVITSGNYSWVLNELTTM